MQKQLEGYQSGKCHAGSSVRGAPDGRVMFKAAKEGGSTGIQAQAVSRARDRDRTTGRRSAGGQTPSPDWFEMLPLDACTQLARGHVHEQRAEARLGLSLAAPRGGCSLTMRCMKAQVLPPHSATSRRCRIACEGGWTPTPQMEKGQQGTAIDGGFLESGKFTFEGRSARIRGSAQAGGFATAPAVPIWRWRLRDAFAGAGGQAGRRAGRGRRKTGVRGLVSFCWTCEIAN